MKLASTSNRGGSGSQHHVHQEGEALVHHAAEVAGGDAHCDGQGAHQQACPEAHHQERCGPLVNWAQRSWPMRLELITSLHAGGWWGERPLGGFVAGRSRGATGPSATR